MAWYWWALIAVAVAAIIWLKILLVPKYLKKQQEKRAQRARMEDED